MLVYWRLSPPVPTTRPGLDCNAGRSSPTIKGSRFTWWGDLPKNDAGLRVHKDMRGFNKDSTNKWWTQHGWMVVADETNHNNMCIIVYLYIYIRYTMSHIHIQGSYGVSCPQQPKSAANPLNWINPGVRCTSPHVSCLLTKFLAVLSG